MKSKKIWYYDGGMLVFGYKNKYGFHPQRGLQCGYDVQKLRRKDYNKIYFTSMINALNLLTKKNMPISCIMGGTLVIGIDTGMYTTKYVISDSKKKYFGKIMTTAINDKSTDNVVADILKNAGINKISGTTIKTFVWKRKISLKKE